MKKTVLLAILVFWVAVTWLPSLAGTGAREQKADAVKECPREGPEREYPIAAGIWYPSDGPIPDKPMRYYRVRCWPGCHSGSTLGMYPDERLGDKPIFPTSTTD